MSTDQNETAQTVEQVRTAADNLHAALDALAQEATPDKFPGLYDGVREFYTFVVEGDLTLREDPKLAEDEEVTLVVTARVRKVKRDTISTTDPVGRVNYTLDLSSVDIVNGQDVASEPNWYDISQRYYTAWDRWFTARRGAQPAQPTRTAPEDDVDRDTRTGFARLFHGARKAS